MPNLLKKLCRISSLIAVVLLLTLLVKLYHSRVTLPPSHHDLARDITSKDTKKPDTILGTLVNNFLTSQLNLKACYFTTQPDQRHVPRINDVWQVLSETPGKVMVFGAYMDKRPNVQYTIIRILGVSTTTTSQAVFCQLWFEAVALPLVLQAKVEDTGRGLKMSGIKYQERLYSCAITFDILKVPQSVSLVFNDCDNSTTNIPIEIPFPEKKFDLGVCVVVAYGNLNPVALVEWLEFNKLLGVKEINIYDSHVNENTHQVLKHYEAEGFVTLRKSAPPMINWCKWCQKLAAIATLNDCLYRNMYKYKHLMVIDFDEYVIPAHFHTIPEMLTFLRRTWIEEPPAYMLRNAYFFTDFTPNNTEPIYLITQRFRTRIEPSKFGYAAKSIVNPRKCLVLQNHYCMLRTPDVKTSFTLNVKPNVALSHHYKKCHLSKAECETHLKHPILDLAATKFSASLNTSVYNQLNVLKLLGK